MTTYRLNGTTIETSYNAALNTWFASVSHGGNCIRKAKKLREGNYPFYNKIRANISYRGKNKASELIDDAVIDFTESCPILSINNEACLNCEV